MIHLAWCLAACGPKRPAEAQVPAEPSGVAAPSAVATSGGLEAPIAVEPVELAPWVVLSHPERGPLHLIWRPGPDADSVEVELDASGVPEATEYTVQVSQWRKADRYASVENLQFEEGPFAVSSPRWLWRPSGGIDSTIMQVSVNFVLQPELELRRKATSSVYVFRDSNDEMVVLDVGLAERAYDRTHWAGGERLLGESGVDFLASVEEVTP